MNWDRNEEGLIVDDGKPRECERNVCKMGFWRTWWNFNGYRSEAKELGRAMPEIAQALATFGTLLIFILLFPVSPFVRAFFQWRRAVKACRSES